MNIRDHPTLWSNNSAFIAYMNEKQNNFPYKDDKTTNLCCIRSLLK
jgi:hypothetical protein